MSISSIGAFTSALSSYQPNASSNPFEVAANTSPLSPGQIHNLRRSLRNDIEQAFQQGKSQSDIESRLEMNISTTLDKFNVSSSDRESITTSLHELFSQQRPTDELRSGVQQLVDRLVNGLPGNAIEASLSPYESVGQTLDVLA